MSQENVEMVAPPCVIDMDANKTVTANFAENDTTPPETTITKGAPNKLDRHKVRFVFTADEADSTFEYKLDRKPFKPSTSPRNVKRLDEGRHGFIKVRATDAAGDTDASAAMDKFRVVG